MQNAMEMLSICSLHNPPPPPKKKKKKKTRIYIVFSLCPQRAPPHPLFIIPMVQMLAIKI